MKKALFTFCMFLLAVTAVAQSSIKVETHQVVAMGEQFSVTFIIEGEDSPNDFRWDSGDDFNLVWGPQSGRNTSVQIINNKRTKSVQNTYSYIVKPVRTGKFTIPRAVAKIKGKEIYSSPVEIEVVNSDASSSTSQTQKSSSSQNRSQTSISDEDIFVTVSLNRDNVVVGEPIIATVKLYQRVNVSGFEGVEFPTFNGFWSQEIEAPSNIEFVRESYKGQIYNAALLRKYILIPQQKGVLTVDPAEMICLVNVRVHSGGTSIFDDFFADYRTIRKKVVSNKATVKVSDLPAGAPSSFAGGVGKFSISAKISKDTVMTHEAASLILTVSGKGNVSLLETPKVSFPPDMEVYDTKISEKIDKAGQTGSKHYEFPFIPRSHGEFVIEPVRYSYYDIDRRKYVTLETPPIHLYVEKGNESGEYAPVIHNMSQKDVKNLADDIRFISTKKPDLVQKGKFFVGSVTFYVILTLLVLLAFLLWTLLRKIAIRKADVVGSKNRKAVKMAMKRLRLAETFLKQNLYTAFYEELHKALLGFVSDKLNMPVSELSKDNICETLMNKNILKEHIDAFVGLLDACEFARYSPSSGYDAMEAHYKQAVEVISSMDLV